SQGAESTARTGGSGLNVRRTDSVSKNLQNQIANAKKQLQELASDENLSMEEKMQKRQEIQKEIATLNQQMRQHEISQRNERQSGKASMDDMLGGSRRENASDSGSGGSGLSQASMQSMISADTSMKQARAQGSTAARINGSARVLKAEIKQDAGRGIDVEKKTEELAGLEQRAQSAVSSQISALADAGRAMSEAMKSDSGSRETKEASESTAAESASQADTTASGAISPAVGTDADAGAVHTHVDIRL
ncbi:MAG: FlxA-like family protein, partial [Lachnospiraceae bacterium]|nr:FlxA-like family protein [Lachnospiraceae bacterium]